MKLDLEGQAFKRDPFPTFDAMRQAGPVIRTHAPFIGPCWITTTHAATLAMVKDKDRFVQEGRHAGRGGAGGFQWWFPRPFKLLMNNMLLKDEPDHRRLRKLVDKAFARRDIQAMRGHIEAVADRLLDRLAGREKVDLAADYTRKLPLEVICELLGLPETHREEFSERARAAMMVKSPLSLFGVMGSFNRMIELVREEIARSRVEPRPGLIAELVRMEAEGDSLDEEELLSMVFLLLVAGFETTTHLIADSMIALETHPEQKEWLLADLDGRMELAVEELARWTSPVQGTKPRYVAQAGELFGAKLKRGEMIMGMIASANSDPTVFEAPRELRLNRLPNPHLVFSSGIHFCLGMQLARVETQAALSRLYARFPNVAVVDVDRLEWVERIGLRGVKSLPVRLAPERLRRAA